MAVIVVLFMASTFLRWFARHADLTRIAANAPPESRPVALSAGPMRPWRARDMGETPEEPSDGQQPRVTTRSEEEGGPDLRTSCGR